MNAVVVAKRWLASYPAVSQNPERRSARRVIRNLIRELEASQQAFEHLLDDKLGEDVGIKSLSTEDGVSTLSMTTQGGVAEQTVLTMMDGLADMLGDAANYIEFDLRRRGKESVSVCVRRLHRPSPHDLRLKAERERDDALAALKRARATIKRLKRNG